MIPLGVIAAAHGRSGGVDPFWDTVSALLNARGADGSAMALDETGRIWTARGDFQIDDSPGHNVMLFDGATASADTPYIGAEFDWWTEDFTIDAVVNPVGLSTWSYIDGSPTPQMIACAEPGTLTNYWSFGPTSGGDLMFYYFNGSVGVRLSGGSVPTGVETQVRMTHKVGEGIRLFVSGSLVAGPVPVTGAPIANPSGVSLTLGRVLSRISGTVRALRISKGVARTAPPGTPPWPTGT